MSRFNTAAKSRVVRKPDKVNLAGGNAYSQSAKGELVAHLLTSMVQDQFYRKAEDGADRLIQLVRGVEPQFAAKAAIFARNEFHMRSVTHIVASEIPAIVKGERWTKNFIDKVVARPDDALEIFALYLARYGKPVPNSLKKGLAMGLSKFDAHQLAKYRAEDKAVSMVDIFNLVHPKPTADNAEAFGKLVDGELRQVNTWENKVSAAGTSENKTEAKSQAWGELIEAKKLGYMAALRNLRNIAQDAPEHLDSVLSYIANPKAVANSKQLPFRFISALEAIEGADLPNGAVTKIRRALNSALDASFSNVPKFEGRTLIALDRSSSMTSTYSSKNGKAAVDYAIPLAVGLLKTNDADFMLYESKAQYVRDLNVDDTFTTLAQDIRKRCRGGGTNVSSVFESAKGKYDRIIILSDNESWVERYRGGNPAKGLEVYKLRTGANPFVYAMDLTGYGDLMFPEKGRKVAHVSGFSDKVFDLFGALEQDPEAVVRKIEAIVL